MNRIWAIFFVSIFFCVSGCTVIFQGKFRSITTKHIDAIELHKTTREDIVELLGEPDHVMYKPDEVQVYVYIHKIERGIGTPFFIYIGRTGSGGQKLTLTFKNGIVVDYEYSIDQLKIFGG